MNMTSYKLDSDQLRFLVDAETEQNGINMNAETDLIEYELTRAYIEVGVIESIDKSQFIINLTFKRRMEYHVTNTFLQTQLLILVGYLSFYFRVDNFTDRIMVTLTVTLVMATIMSGIQGGLPKTSYYKLIDYWLLYCLLTLIMTFVLHTLVGAAFDGRKFFFGLEPGPNLARKVNKLGEIIVLSFIICINVAFWTIAMREYVKSN